MSVDNSLNFTDHCILTSIGQNLSRFQDYDRDAIIRISRYHQAIIPSYRFTCCGEIRAWGVDADGGGDDEQYTLNLQVWRSSPTIDQMDSGDYSLVGNNRFTSIFLSSGVAVVTPSPQDLIQFQPGDVLGFYVEEARNDNSKGVVILTTASYTNELPVPLRQWLAVPSQLGVVEI